MAVAGGTVITRDQIGFARAQSGGSIRFYKQVSPFVNYERIVLNEQAGKHSRGRPFGSTPGRAPKRVRG